MCSLNSCAAIDASSVFVPNCRSQLASVVAHRPTVHPSAATISATFDLPFSDFQFAGDSGLLLSSEKLAVACGPCAVTYKTIKAVGVTLPAGRVTSVVSAASAINEFLLGWGVFCVLHAGHCPRNGPP